MKQIKCLLVLGLTVGILAAGNLFSHAAIKPRLTEKPAITSAAPARVKLPDLVVRSVAWSAPPKDGTTVGTAAVLHIAVKNQGTADAGASKLKIKCTSFAGNDCPSCLNGILDIPALAPGKSFALSWPSMSSEKWASGRFRLDISADIKDSVRESNESNNVRSLSFTVAPETNKNMNSPLGSKSIDKKPTIAKVEKQGIELIKKPDIVVTGVTPVPAELKAGDPVRFNVSFENRGNEVSQRSEGKVHFQTNYAGHHFSGEVKTMLPILSPGQSVTVLSEEGKLLTSYGAPAGGDYTLRMSADTINRIDEQNETNNLLTASMSVQRRLDFTVRDIAGENLDKPGSGIKLKKLSVNKGNRVYLMFEIRACERFFGNIPLPGKVVVKVTGFADWVVPAQFLKRSSDGVDTRYTFTLVRSWTTPGEKRITVHADVDNEVEESIEFNNTGLFIVDVY